MSLGCPDFQASSPVSRRCLIRAGTAGFAGLNLASALRATEVGSTRIQAKAKQVIFLHQWGGPSHLDTFDMKPDAPSGIRGTFKPIPSTTPGLWLTEHLPRFSKVLGKFAQIRSVYHRMKNHNSAGYYSLTGHAPPLDDQRLRDSVDLYPAYGSIVNKFFPVSDPAIPTFVSYPYVIRDGSVTPGQHGSFLGKANDPFFVGQAPNRPDFRLPELSLPASMPLDRLDDRRGLLRMIDRQGELLEWNAAAKGIDSFHDRALGMLASPKVKRAFDLGGEKPETRDAYGRTAYGQSCLLARRLIESGVKFVTVYFSTSIGNGGKGGDGGWDTHNNNFDDLKDRLLPLTDRAVPALIDDLAGRGLLDDTLVLWMGEFGRTPKIGANPNFSSDGRDHWPQCYTVLMAGGGVTPGAVYGASDRLGAYPSLNPVKPDDVAATLFWALGIDPSSEVYDTLKRPLPIASGRPITEIFG